MPQLDKITFISQILWLLPILLVTYWFILKWVLPAIAAILKLRNRLIKELSLSTSSINNEGFFILSQKQRYTNNMVQVAISSIKNTKDGINFENKIDFINITSGVEFKEVNEIFINNFVSIYLILSLVKINKNV
jgi:hypothetical protein